MTLPKAITALSPQEKTALKEKAQLEGEDYTELPAKVVFTAKPDKYKVRIVACGDQTRDTCGKITTAAFLNADLPPGRVVVLRPPTILYKLGSHPYWLCVASA